MAPSPDETFLARGPVPAVPAEPGEGDLLVLVRPKILSPRWSWLLRWMQRPVYRVRLDARGSAAWRACDGVRTMAGVIEAVAAAFPDDPDTAPRTTRFLVELARGGFLTLRPPGAGPAASDR